MLWTDLANGAKGSWNFWSDVEHETSSYKRPESPFSNYTRILNFDSWKKLKIHTLILVKFCCPKSDQKIAKFRIAPKEVDANLVRFWSRLICIVCSIWYAWLKSEKAFCQKIRSSYSKSFSQIAGYYIESNRAKSDYWHWFKYDMQLRQIAK